MGRSSVEATNARLMRAVRAIRCALVPRLRDFLCAAVLFLAALGFDALLLEEVFFV
jgi:hypothetical protein